MGGFVHPRQRIRQSEKGWPSFMARTKLIVNLTRGDAVCVSELADRPLGRMRGLLGRPGLPAGEGLLLSPAPAIHTGFMRFPIDAVFLDRDLVVLDIVEQLRPWRFASKRGARAVLELAAGECARRGLAIGDRLGLRERAATGADQCHAQDSDDAVSLERVIAPAAAQRRGELARLQPMRVLVISPDRHFRTVTALLLPRRGCCVTTTANSSRVPELVARERADVVVIDASRSPTPAPHRIASADARPVGVVVVANEARSEPQEPPVLAKWGPFGDLFAAIEEADMGRRTSEGTHARG